MANLARVLGPLAIGLMDELVELTCFVPADADTAGLPSPPIEIVPYGRLKVWRFATPAIDTLAEEVRRRKFNLLHALDAQAGELTRTLSAMTGVRFIVSSYCVGDARPLHSAGAPSEAILAASEHVRRDLITHRLAVASKIHLVRPGIYMVKQATCFITPSHSVTIVAGGSLDYLNSFLAVLQAFATLQQGGYDCSFFIIGSGSGERKLRARVEQLKLQDDVTFTPRQPSVQLAGIFKAADIYISPAQSNCIDVESLLAMASGVPVLATADKASDFLVDGQTAMMYREGDAGALTARLTGLLDDKPSATALAEAALSYVRENHSSSRMMQATLDIYRQCAK